MATQKRQIYRCPVCGIVAEIIQAGGGELICCGQPMILMDENTKDAAPEKHVPVIEPGDTGTTVKVGSAAHPMEPRHYIEWIEVITDGGTCRRFLAPGDAPEASFTLEAAPLAARALCNQHGLWRSQRPA